MRIFIGLSIIIAILSISGCSSSGPQSGVLARKGLCPFVAVSNSGLINVTYGFQDSIFYQESSNNGKTFGQPTLVGTVSDLPLMMGSGPQISVSDKYKTIVAPGIGGMLYAWYIDSQNQGWQGPVTINDVEGSAMESLVSITFINDTTLIAVWIDNRENEHTHGEHPTIKLPEEIKFVTPIPGALQQKFKYPDENGELRWVIKDGDGNLIDVEDIESYKNFVEANKGMKQPKAKLYASLSYNGGATWSNNSLVYSSPDGSICECCKPDVIANGLANVSILFRNNINGNRDMYLANSINSGLSFESVKKLGKKSWPLKGCPMDGGDVAVVGTDATIAIWQREGKIYTSSTAEDETLIADGISGKVAVTANGIYLAWIDGMDIMLLSPAKSIPVNLGAGSNLQIASLNGSSNTILMWNDGEQLKYYII